MSVTTETRLQGNMRQIPIVTAPRSTHRGRRRVAISPFTRKILLGASGFIAAALLWEFMRRTGFASPEDFPSFWQILLAAIAGLEGGALAQSIWATLCSWAPGLCLAAVVGISSGTALALVPRLEISTRPILEFLRPIPSVALIPVVLPIFGIGMSLQLFMIAFASVWPILFATKSGVEGIDPRYIETGRMLGLRRVEQIVRIVLPGALPSMATGLRTAASIALVLAITVEILTGQAGIGSFIENVRLNGQVVDMWAAIFVIGGIGFFINAFFLMVERIALPWSPENRAH